MAQIMTKGRKGEGMVGCDFHNDCFTCPYPDCILGSGINKVSLARKKRAIDLDNSGMRPKRIAETIGVTKRQVFRYLRK